MKKVILPVALCLAALFFVSTLAAQNYWVGGTPGKESDWNTAKNWSQNRIPDWTQDVIIPDVSTQSGYFPIIDSDVDPIPHLAIYSNAILTILREGKITIDGKTTFNSGLYLVGKIISKGDVVIINTALIEIDNKGGEMIFDNKMLARN